MHFQPGGPNGCSHATAIGILLFLMAGAASAGELKPPRVIAAGSFPFGVAVGDFNEDGKLDLAVANSNLLSQQTSSLGVFLGNGDGTLQPMVSYQVGQTPRAVVVGDFNGDGHLDLAVANFVEKAAPGQVTVLIGNGDGTFNPPVQYAAGVVPQA